MSDVTSNRQAKTTTTALWTGIAAVLLLVLGANAHLLYVAIRSQPSCVAHVRQGENKAGSDSFGAALSACSLSESELQSGK